MEKSRAIEKLNDIRCHVKETSAEEQALVMAIDALKAQLSREGATSDLISRQAALDALDKRFDNIPMEQTAEILMLRKDLRELPTIQPQSTTGQLNDGAQSTNLIDRQQAIDALWKALYEYEDKTEKQFQESEDLDIQDWIQHRIFVQNMNDIDRQTILKLPPAQPEPKEGHWIGKYPTTYICSECGWLIPDSKVKVFAYCPNCGAKMKGASE